jgi:hypothetical protein
LLLLAHAWTVSRASLEMPLDVLDLMKNVGMLFAQFLSIAF